MSCANYTLKLTNNWIKWNSHSASTITTVKPQTHTQSISTACPQCQIMEMLPCRTKIHPQTSSYTQVVCVCGGVCAGLACNQGNSSSFNLEAFQLLNCFTKHRVITCVQVKPTGGSWGKFKTREYRTCRTVTRDATSVLRSINVETRENEQIRCSNNINILTLMSWVSGLVDMHGAVIK